MSGFYYGAPHHQSHLGAHSHNHHGGRSRRAPRISSQHHPHKQFNRPARSPKQVVPDPNLEIYVQMFEAARSFDFDDDEIFCPFHLFTDDDLQSVHSGSDRSSLASSSPEGSPLQHQIQPTPTFLMPSSASSSGSYAGYQQSTHTKLHQPLAQRARNPIPIVDPTTRAVANSASPPPSVSPARQMQQQFMARPW